MLTPLSTMVFSSARIDALYRGYVFCHANSIDVSLYASWFHKCVATNDFSSKRDMLLGRNMELMEYLKTLMEYMSAWDYVILHVVLLAMSYLISGKFARKLFKKTAMGSYREEA